MPDWILSDNGAAFTSGVLKELTNYFGVPHNYTTPFHPAADGQTERMNRTLLAMLAKVCYADPLLWDEYLTWVLLGYNATPHSTTKFSPYQILFGRNLTLPSCQTIAAIRSPYTVDPLDWWDTLAQKMPEYWRTATLNIQAMNAVNKKFFDRKIHPYEIKIGDKVLWCDNLGMNKPTRKLECCWSGPFKVMDISINWTQVKLELKPPSGGHWHIITVAVCHVL